MSDDEKAAYILMERINPTEIVSKLLKYGEILEVIIYVWYNI